jgi:hypothetical protein
MTNHLLVKEQVFLNFLHWAYLTDKFRITIQNNCQKILFRTGGKIKIKPKICNDPDSGVNTGVLWGLTAEPLQNIFSGGLNVVFDCHVVSILIIATLS